MKVRAHRDDPEASPIDSQSLDMPRTRIATALLFALLTLLAGELVLQARAQLRTGQSAFTLLKGQTTYVTNDKTGLRTIRPSSVITGEIQTIRSNQYGLRGPDFDSAPEPNELRIALLGASTILGAFAPDSDQTSSAALERRLAISDPASRYRVINAGLGGATVEAQVRLMERLLADLGVRIVIWYPGTNDIDCEVPLGTKRKPRPRLEWPGLPRWVLTSDLISKNTIWLRRSQTPNSQTLVPSHDMNELETTLRMGIRFAHAKGIRLVLVTSAKSYTSAMPPDEIAARAAGSLLFRPCFTATQLAVEVDTLNDLIRSVARDTQVPLIDMDRLMSGQLEQFGDATHFSADGEERFAELLARDLTLLNVLAP